MPLTLQTPIEESASSGALPATTSFPVSEKMLFSSTPQRRSRLPGVAGSAVLHLLLLAVMALWRVSTPTHSTVESVRHHYSVRFVQLQMPPEYRRRQPPEADPATAQVHDPVNTQASAGRLSAPSARGAGATAAAASPRDLTPREHRQFKLPASVRVQPVKQTLVQMDLPPAITLKQEIPLPTMLLWTETAAPPMRRRFVAPPVRREVPKVTQSLPAAPTLSAPNRELSPAELNVAEVIPTEAPHLVHPPSVASPVSRTGQEPAKEIPQIGLAGSAQASAVNLISLPANPLRSAGVLVLPPANQIAPGDAGVAGSPKGHENGTGTGAGERSGGAQGHGLLASAGSGAAGVSGGNGSGAAPSSTSAGGSGSTGGAASGSGAAAAGNGKAAMGAGSWSASGSAIGTALPGTTRIDLPKEGQYGVVVFGSASSAQYPESAGALSGKVVYTVYLKVGLRKSWILQYCLPSKTQSAANGQSTTPVQAPWPFLIMRPDQRGAADPDYIIVHGMVTDAGKFDQLAMVFPDELEKKDLLMNSLKLWAFRPATRDGVRVPVEVLLIIPREEE